MERKELYAKIKELGLQDEVKKTFGKNFTMVGNADLEKIIWNYDATLASKDMGDEVKPTKEPEETPEPIDTTETTDAYEAACIAFVAILNDSGKLDDILAKL